jgi:glycosyltransferase involved in cell wall biosynthesis
MRGPRLGSRRAISSKVVAVAGHIDSNPRRTHRELHSRLQTLLTTLGGTSGSSTGDLLDGVAVALADGAIDKMWLALAVLSGQLPDTPTLLRACRQAELDGPLAALGSCVSGRDDPSGGGGVVRRRVEVLTGRVVVDLHHTSGANFTTGIQRVAREVARRWATTHDPVLVGWTKDYTALHRLPPAAAGANQGDNGTLPSAISAVDSDRTSIVVPWRCTYVLPELLGEAGRVDRFQCLAHHSGNHSAVIGFDCVPMTTGETSIEGMGADFAHYLAAVAHTERVAAISEAAAGEFKGWRHMLEGAGLAGPDITAVPLPVESPLPSRAAMETAREQLAVVGMPMVLVVGSHEPRKNHRAVLHAAELLWRDGLTFSLLFVGGNSWNSERFTRALHDLQAAGRPVHAVRALTDDLLRAAYTIAYCTLFPSFNEGFGLPVAESIASGTPVITSNFGSMREIAGPGGALLVDPRDDHDIARALKSLLTDDDLRASLAREIRARPQRTWEEYAEETWDYLVHARPPRP